MREKDWVINNFFTMI